MAKLRLTSILNDKKISQQQLANATGINKSTINRYCNNSFEKIDKWHLDDICTYLDITPNELFEIESMDDFDDYTSLSEILEEYALKTDHERSEYIQFYINSLNDKLNLLISKQKSILKEIESVTLEIEKSSKEIIRIKKEPYKTNDILSQVFYYLKFHILYEIYHSNYSNLYSDILTKNNILERYENFKDTFCELILDGYINQNTLLFIENHKFLHPYLKLYFNQMYDMFMKDYYSSFK